MFSGIISAIGTLDRVERRGEGLQLSISTGLLDLNDVQQGDSIAVNGICLTVVEKSGTHFEADVSAETLRCTTGLDTPGGQVNLEKALRLSDRLNGHLVSGHVDGIGVVASCIPAGENRALTVRVPAGLEKYLAIKGSVTMQGVSLTINAVNGSEFSVNLIPHTLHATNLKDLAPGSRVNLEVDMLARYVERMLSAGN